MLHFPSVSGSLFSGFAGALWLVGLWYAAPAISPREPSLASRVAAVGILGVGLPFALGLADLLYAWALWLALALVVAVRIGRRGVLDRAEDATRRWDLTMLIGVLVAIAWPAAVRPLMDGDSLSYHLPNAASWVVHHGVWTTGTRYWWYPGGSELFASGLFAIAGAPLVGVAGLVPALLIGLRLRAIAIAAGNRPLLGTSIACALLASTVVAQEMISLQNDLWLAAYFLEALVSLQPTAVALSALVKPYGFVLAAVVSIVRGAEAMKKPWLWLAAFVAPAVWAIRDALLLPSAIVSPASTWYPNTASTSIAAHFPGSLAVLAQATWDADAAWTVLSVSALAAVVLSREAWVRWAALASLGLFVLVPFGYNNDIAQLSTGQSLRYALPLIAIGAAALCMLRSRLADVLIPLALVSCLFEIAAVWNVYWNDALTHDVWYALAFAAIAMAAITVLRSSPLRPVVAAIAFVALCSWSAGLAGARPAAYLADRYGVDGVPAGVFAMFGSTTFPRVVVVRLPAGAASLLRPDVDAYDAEPAQACARARTLHAPLLIGLPDGAAALACGRIIFRDRSSALVETV